MSSCETGTIYLVITYSQSGACSIFIGLVPHLLGPRTGGAVHPPPTPPTTAFTLMRQKNFFAKSDKKVTKVKKSVIKWILTCQLCLF